VAGGTGVIAAAALGSLLAASAVWMNSSAAFTSSTSNSGNAWTAGQLALTNDSLTPSPQAMFTAGGLIPGSGGARCIVVTYNGNVGAVVKVYAAGYAQTNGLADYLDLTIEEGTGSSFSGSGPATCTGFTPDAGPAVFTGTAAAFGAKLTHAAGVGAFAPAGAGQSKTYRITYKLQPLAPDSTQSGTSDLGFVWEARSS
jgi:hypothetical protein